jgi:hypothetical protein
MFAAVTPDEPDHVHVEDGKESSTHTFCLPATAIRSADAIPNAIPTARFRPSRVSHGCACCGRSAICKVYLERASSPKARVGRCLLRPADDPGPSQAEPIEGPESSLTPSFDILNGRRSTPKVGRDTCTSQSFPLGERGPGDQPSLGPRFAYGTKLRYRERATTPMAGPVLNLGARSRRRVSGSRNPHAGPRLVPSGCGHPDRPTRIWAAAAIRGTVIPADETGHEG